MVKNVLAFLIFASLSLQACEKGCLKCGENGDCRVCDTRNYFYLWNGTCQSHNRGDCLTLLQSGQCLQCASGFYLDANAGNCALVNTLNLIANCKLYNSALECVRCADGYFLLNRQCTKVNHLIPNCDVYAFTGLCVKCQNGFIFNPDRTGCVPKPAIPFCSGFSSVRCARCANGYFPNRNLYFKDFYSQSADSLAQYVYEFLNTGGWTEWMNARICQPITVKNCVVAATLTTCRVCAAGYFLGPDSLCQPILATLSNCATRDPSNNNCILCNSGYFLDSTRACQPRTVTGCLTYNLNKDVCSSCVSGKYLSGSGVCQTRQNTSCATYNLNSDACESCNPSSKYLSNYACVQGTAANCLLFTFDSNTCQACTVSTHYLSSAACIARTMTACASFEPLTDQCITCFLTSHYLNASKQCIPRTRTNCLTYSLTSDACLSCSTGTYLSSPDCLANTAQNCLVKSTTANLCVTCVPNVYRDAADNLCKVYTVSNCLAYKPDRDHCVQCNSLSYPNGNNGCILNTAINCALFSRSDNSCIICNQSTFRSSSVCTNYSVANCYQKSTSSDSCLICSPGYYLNSGQCPQNTSTNCAVKSITANTCDACLSGYYAQTSSTCTAYTVVSNCKTYSPNSNQCTACNDFYYLNGSNQCVANSEGVLHCNRYTASNVCTQCTDPYLLTSSSLCSEIQQASKITDCLTYNNAISTVACTKCVAGKFVQNNQCVTRVNNSITNCSAYDPLADKCATCANTFVLTSDGLKCLAQVAQCKTYAASSVSTASLSCTVCNDEYYLASATSCLLGSANCVGYSSSSNCVACAAGFYQAFTNTPCAAHTATIANCSAMSTSTANTCATCAAGFHAFTISETCQSATPVSQCAEYNQTTGACVVCKANYYLNASSQCSALPLNCERMSEDLASCAKCVDGWALDSVSKICFSPFKYSSTHCQTASSGVSFQKGNDNFAYCKECKANKAPFNLAGASVCVESALAKYRGLITTSGDPGKNSVDNCIRYSNGSTPVCLECGSGYWLSDIRAASPTCTQTACTASQVLLLDNLDGRVYGCITPTSNLNCKVAVRINVNGDIASNFACVQVRSGFYPVFSQFISDTPNIGHRPKADSDATAFTVSPAEYYYRGYLLTATTIAAADIKWATDAGAACELYYKGTNDKYYCYRTTLGNTVTLYEDATPSLIHTSKQISDCDTATVYTGYPSYITAILSCHKCTTDGNFPKLSVQLSTTEPKIWNGFKWEDVDKVSCATPGTATNNCGVYADIIDGAATTFTCVSCLPGYSMGSVDPLTKAVSTCDLIADCDLTSADNKLANRCGKCKAANASGKPLAFLDSEQTKCVATTTDNCLFVKSSSLADGAYQCAVCSPGYYLNLDKKCEALALPGCSDSSSTIFGTVTNADVQKYLTVKYRAQANIFGCNTCAGSDILMRAGALDTQCIDSPYITAGSFLATGSSYIASCSQHTNSINAALTTPRLRCVKCASGKIATDDNLSCVATISNCDFAKASDPTKCSKCTTPNINVSGVCSAPSITGCKIYQDTSSSQTQLCSQCNDGFSLGLLNNSCTTGTITNCKSYSQGSTADCTECLPGFGLISFGSNVKLCIDIQTKTKCLVADATTNGLAGSILKCTKCFSSDSEAWVVKPLNQLTNYATSGRNVCFTHPTTSNCVAYDGNAALMSSNTFKCTSCDTGFYLRSSDFQCPARSSIPNCTAFAPTSDTCTQCASFYYLNAGGGSCVAFPVPVLNCRNFSAVNTCAACEPNFYLNGNACVPVTNIIINCLHYADATTCDRCFSGFFISSNACVAITASNCLTLTAYNQCASCSPGNGLKTRVDGVTIDCVSRDVSNCVATSQSYPFCSSCLPGYFVNATGQCVSPSPIQLCISYDSLTTCASCSYPYIPNQAKTSCIISINNCSTYFGLYSCFTCNTGYFPTADYSACNVPNIANCATYSALTVCQTCNANYFPSADGSSCIQATSVANCKTYSSLTTCTACNTPYILESNACNLQQVIANCVSYASTSTCQTCQSNTFINLARTVCQVPTITSCTTFSSLTSCLVCNNGYFRSLSGDSCTLIVVVPGCQSYSSPTTCSACQSNYWLIGNACYQQITISGCVTYLTYNVCKVCSQGLFAVGNSCLPGIVDNCLNHDTYNTCNQCSAGLVLSMDRRSCLDTYGAFMDPNCQSSELVATPYCSMCSPGYFFRGDGSCGSCTSKLYSDGCFSCNPDDQSVCYICKSGYYQDSSGNCIAYAAYTSDTSVNTGATNSTSPANGTIVSQSAIKAEDDSLPGVDRLSQTASGGGLLAFAAWALLWLIPYSSMN